MPRRPSVLFLPEGGPENPCPYYRAFLPARALRLHYWQTFVGNGQEYVAEDDRFTSPALDRPTDIVVIRRPVGPDGITGVDYSEHIQAARNAGQRVYVDIDDDLWHTPATNPAHAIHTPESLRAFVNTINASDGLLVSTPGLGETMRSIVTVPVHVCPNGIDPSLYFLYKGEHKPLRIGWLGPWKWRCDDLASVADWLVPFLNERPNVEFWHMGAMPKDEGRPQDVLKGLKRPVFRIPWYPFPALEQSLVQTDVLMIPQRTGGDYDYFANSRSPTSAMAAIASGLVVWATPIKSYVEFFGDALPPDLASVVDDPATRRHYRREQKKLLSKVNLEATAKAYEKVFYGQ